MICYLCASLDFGHKQLAIKGGSNTLYKDEWKKLFLRLAFFTTQFLVKWFGKIIQLESPRSDFRQAAVPEWSTE